MLSLGLDFGTSGARASLIDRDSRELWTGRAGWDMRLADTERWQQALYQSLAALPPERTAHIRDIAVDSTSGTVLLVDAALQPVTPVLNYDHPLANDPAAKLAWLKQHDRQRRARHLLHQADYINSLLLGERPACDVNNALKSGFDPSGMTWRNGVYNVDEFSLLPEIVLPGQPIGTLDRALALRFGLDPACRVHAGTTDSMAAFIAAGELSPGSAVTSLGSTLAIKLVSERPVSSAAHGVYSHKLGEFWLTGGASNSGGAVLRHYFSDTELQRLSTGIDPNADSPYDYYPLLAPGERFPVNDPHWPQQLEPRPDDPTAWLHGLLQGMARIEAQGYRLLHQLGAPAPVCIVTAGGGSRNRTWMALRQRIIGVPVEAAVHNEAAYGSARLASDNSKPSASQHSSPPANE